MVVAVVGEVEVLLLLLLLLLLSRRRRGMQYAPARRQPCARPATH